MQESARKLKEDALGSGSVGSNRVLGIARDGRGALLV